MQEIISHKMRFFAVDISHGATGGTGSAAQELRGLGETARGPMGAPGPPGGRITMICVGKNGTIMG